MNLNLKNLLRRARARLLTSSRKRSIAAKAGWELRRERIKVTVHFANQTITKVIPTKRVEKIAIQ